MNLHRSDNQTSPTTPPYVLKHPALPSAEGLTKKECSVFVFSSAFRLHKFTGFSYPYVIRFKRASEQLQSCYHSSKKTENQQLVTFVRVKNLWLFQNKIFFVFLFNTSLDNGWWIAPSFTSRYVAGIINVLYLRVIVITVFPTGRSSYPYMFTKRSYSITEQSFPKLTTHYTVYPREKDPRWEGNASKSIFNSCK